MKISKELKDFINSNDNILHISDDKISTKLESKPGDYYLFKVSMNNVIALFKMYDLVFTEKFYTDYILTVNKKTDEIIHMSYDYKDHIRYYNYNFNGGKKSKDFKNFCIDGLVNKSDLDNLSILFNDIENRAKEYSQNYCENLHKEFEKEFDFDLYRDEGEKCFKGVNMYNNPFDTYKLEFSPMILDSYLDGKLEEYIDNHIEPLKERYKKYYCTKLAAEKIENEKNVGVSAEKQNILDILFNTDCSQYKIFYKTPGNNIDSIILKKNSSQYNKVKSEILNNEGILGKIPIEAITKISYKKNIYFIKNEKDVIADENLASAYLKTKYPLTYITEILSNFNDNKKLMIELMNSKEEIYWNTAAFEYFKNLDQKLKDDFEVIEVYLKNAKKLDKNLFNHISYAVYNSKQFVDLVFKYRDNFKYDRVEQYLLNNISAKNFSMEQIFKLLEKGEISEVINKFDESIINSEEFLEKMNKCCSYSSQYILERLMHKLTKENLIKYIPKDMMVNNILYANKYVLEDKEFLLNVLKTGKVKIDYYDFYSSDFNKIEDYKKDIRIMEGIAYNLLQDDHMIQIFAEYFDIDLTDNEVLQSLSAINPIFVSRMTKCDKDIFYEAAVSSISNAEYIEEENCFKFKTDFGKINIDMNHSSITLENNDETRYNTLPKEDILFVKDNLIDYLNNRYGMSLNQSNFYKKIRNELPEIIESERELKEER